MDRRRGVRTFVGGRNARIRCAFRRTWKRSRAPPSDSVGPPNRCSALDGCRPFGRGTVGRLTRDDQLRTVDTRRATSLTRVCVRDALNTSRACISARSSVDRRSSAPTNCVRPVRSGSRSSRGYIVESAHKRSARPSTDRRSEQLPLAGYASEAGRAHRFESQVRTRGELPNRPRDDDLIVGRLVQDA